MATINELIAALNASSDNILANAAKLNTTADSMNQNLDGILGVQEVQPLDRDETESFTTTNIVDGPQTEVGLTDTSKAIMGTDTPAPRNFLSDMAEAAKKYIQSGGLIGLGARGLGTLFGDLNNNPIDQFNRTFSVQQYGDPYGYNMTRGNLPGKDPFGINTVSQFGDYQIHYQDYLNAFENQTKVPGLMGSGLFSYVPSQTSQFAIDKADFAREVLGLKDTSPNITGTPLITGTSNFQNDNRGSGGGGFDTSAADSAGTSAGSGQFSPRTSRGRSGY